MNPSTKTTTLIGLLVVLIIVAGLLLALSQTAKEQRILSINSFEECKAAGYPIMESYPEQCRTPDGRLFINESQQAGGASGTFEANGCAVAGCSQTLCVEASEASDIVTTCEYRAEYACYKEASCERQSDGKCGWTQTAELKACLAHPPAIDGTVQPVM